MIGTAGRACGAWLAAALLLAACQTAGGHRAVSVSPGDLEGAPPSNVLALLGEPELRRTEPPAEVWQYRTERCVADIYLRQDGAAQRVVYIETRSPNAATVPAAGCLQDIATVRASGGATGRS
ncbi:MAG: hypothetical protein H6843_10260 [Rhodospirillaceae bacterium]|nr:hypothetical protein [Rhodospirillaceae bacterium]